MPMQNHRCSLCSFMISDEGQKQDTLNDLVSLFPLPASVPPSCFFCMSCLINKPRNYSIKDPSPFSNDTEKNLRRREWKGKQLPRSSEPCLSLHPTYDLQYFAVYYVFPHFWLKLSRKNILF